MNDRVRALVVEDEAPARQRLLELLGKVDWIECIGAAETGDRAVALIDQLRPDLVFLDIQLPGLSGLDVLRRARHQPAVIFTTAYDRYAVSAFELEALDYVLKPFGEERLLVALRRARRALEERDDEPLRERAARALSGSDATTAQEPLSRFFARDRGRLVPIDVRDIVRLEADDDYVRVFTRERSYLVYLTLNDFERRLDPERFLRIHRTHIVNLDCVSQLVPLEGSRIQVELRDGTKITASRARSRALRERTF
ncbi:MAG TPA: LytTR family DNA-binding domain-containing protein [Gemmatimonadaceae bacterium]|nr:LytTR family DNA-binding domain-containing protein [Gemmatimonadaceae bacterium]